MHLLHSAKYQLFAIFCAVGAMCCVTYCAAWHFKVRYFLSLAAGVVVLVFLLSSFLAANLLR